MFVQAFCEASPGDWFIGRALLAGTPVAAMLVCLFGNSAEHYVGWFGPDGRGVSAGDYLYRNVVLEARRRGRQRFDPGGYSPTEKGGVRQFKRGMGGAEYILASEKLAF